MSATIPPHATPVSKPDFDIVPMTVYVEVPRPPQDLPEDDGVPLESDWHRIEIGLLIDSLCWHLRDRRDFFAGGNMFVHFSEKEVRNQEFRGPDFFYVKGVERDKQRPYWAIWKEDGKYPDVIVELGSPSTIENDRTVKKAVYEKRFRTPEYFIYDPEQQRLEGFNLHGNRYKPKKPNDKGWLWCDELELWLGLWEGDYQGRHYVFLRWFDKDGSLVPTAEEGERQHAQAERKKAEAARKKVKAERKKGEAERKKADAERQRAEAAEAEVARLQALLKQQKPPTA
ncbi:MAG: Uma2 family endonuclease [Gemmataceae bacterium]